MSAQHTAGPWMAAAGPSSVVGWPVVARGGRSICNVSWLGHRPAHVTDEQWTAFYVETQANASLIAAAPELLEALRPFAAVMADIGETEADEDTFRNANRAYAKAPAITVGDIRKAAALFSLATGESK